MQVLKNQNRGGAPESNPYQLGEYNQRSGAPNSNVMNNNNRVPELYQSEQ